MNKVEFTVNPRGVCDFSGDEIETMKPSFRLFGIIIMSKESGEEFVNILKNIEKEKQVRKFNIDIFYNEASRTKECDMCEENMNNYVALLHKTKGYTKNNRFLCEECCSEICEEMKEMLSDFERTFPFWDDSGYCVWDGKKTKTLYDSGKNQSTKQKTIIKIGGSPGVCIRLSNVERFLDDIDKNERNIDISKECFVCHRSKIALVEINGVEGLCEECRYCLSNELEKFIEKNKDFIMSRTI